MSSTPEAMVNVAEAKKQFSDLLGRVAYRGEVVIITRRGKPMAKLVPPTFTENVRHLGNVKGWLDADDPYFALLEQVLATRARHVPRVLRGRRRRKATAR